MPRGEHPNSRANLVVNSERTPKQREKQARKAGKASGEARATYKSLKEDMKERCTAERVAKMNDRVLMMAEHGNLRAFEIVQRILGEDPDLEIKREDLKLRKAQAEQKTGTSADVEDLKPLAEMLNEPDD